MKEWVAFTHHTPYKGWTQKKRNGGSQMEKPDQGGKISKVGKRIRCLNLVHAEVKASALKLIEATQICYHFLLGFQSNLSRAAEFNEEHDKIAGTTRWLVNSGLFTLAILSRNPQYDFPKMGGGQRPFGIFPKIHPFWRRRLSLREGPPYQNG